MINLMSDTVTRPTTAMLEAMMAAEVGDDVFGEDPTVNALEQKAADLFGMDAAVFCPSGTMTNQIAIGVHCNRLDEVICDHYSHIYQYETGGYASNSGVAINLIQGTNGKITADQVKIAIKADYDWLPRTSLVVVENTCNKGGGSIYQLPELQSIKRVTFEHSIKYHVDGARLFNALVETKDSPESYGDIFDTISICLSKGLGAPVGSLLLGNKKDIYKARRLRKSMGGGMRQAGYLAAAGIYALDHHIDRLKEDNHHAKVIGEVLKELPYISDVRPVQSNIVIFDLVEDKSVDDMLAYLNEHGIKAVQFGPQSIRFVFHLDITSSMVDRLIEVLKKWQ